MISLFAWNESFLTHLPSVDEQHQRLVALINDLSELVMSSDEIDPQAFATVRDAILDFARTHFCDEEAQIEAAGLDSRHLDLQREEHDSFIREALAISASGDRISHDQARGLVDYLVNWLAYHILHVDQSMARQVRAISAGLAPAQAFEDDAKFIQSGTEPLLATLKGLFLTVSERNRDLRLLNADLEERVMQRTLELEQDNHQLQLLSTQDDLTALPNRRFAIFTLRQLWAEAQRHEEPLSVLVLDADHFKEVNDRHGHATGDALLVVLANLLRDTVRNSDIVCRLGGDEFLVICPRSSLTAAAEVAKRILAAAQPYRNEEGVECWNGFVSIGIAEADRNMAYLDDLLKAADKAMYAAKRQGGGRMAGGADS